MTSLRPPPAYILRIEPLKREIDYKEAALAVVRVARTFRAAQNKSSMDRKIMSDLENVALELIRMAEWHAPPAERTERIELDGTRQG